MWQKGVEDVWLYIFYLFWITIFQKYIGEGVMVYENALNIFIQYLLDFCVKIWILDTIQNGILEFRSFLIGCVYKNDVLQCTHYC